MEKQRKTAAELEEILKARMGAGDFRVKNPTAQTGRHQVCTSGLSAGPKPRCARSVPRAWRSRTSWASCGPPWHSSPNANCQSLKLPGSYPP